LVGLRLLYASSSTLYRPEGCALACHVSASTMSPLRSLSAMCSVWTFLGVLAGVLARFSRAMRSRNPRASLHVGPLRMLYVERSPWNSFKVGQCILHPARVLAVRYMLPLSCVALLALTSCYCFKDLCACANSLLLVLPVLLCYCATCATLLSRTELEVLPVLLVLPEPR
jgi:hypothetical protein